MRKAAAITALTAGAIILAGCSGASPGGESAVDPGADAQQVTIAMVTSACLPMYPTYVAHDLGYFAENGLDVEIQPVNGSAAVLQALLSEQADIGTPGATPLIFSAVEGQDVKYVANTMPGGAFSLITPSETGIAAASDLAGKTIGVSTADGGEVAFLKAVMQAEGLEDGDYEILVVGEGGQAVAGFSRGDIDAFAASPEGVAVLATSGLDIQDVSGTSTGHMFGNGLAATGAFIEANGETIGAFGEAFHRAAEYGMENPDEVLEICGRYQPQEIEDPEFAEAMLEAFAKSQTSPDGAEFGYNNPEHWQRIVDDLVAAGELDEGAIQVDALFTNDFVEAFNK